jgi:diadenosine tetraphosphate (Ap4A) HIT family hydrolase
MNPDRDPACIFCRILDGKAEASIVAREAHATAFMDVAPVVEGHVLVIPNYHTADLAGMDERAGGAVYNLARRVAAGLRASGLPCEGINLFQADGAIAGQTVFHAHVHVIPRHRGDGFAVQLHVPGRHSPSRERLNELARRIAPPRS